MAQSGRGGRRVARLIRSLLRRHDLAIHVAQAAAIGPRVEALEQRVLMAADLSAVFDFDPNPTAASGAPVEVGIFLTNNGDAKFTGKLEVDLFLSADDVLDDGDIFLGRTSASGTLDPAETADVDLKSAIPASVPAGTYKVIGVLDPANKIAEDDEGNNEFVSEDAEITQPDHDLSATVTDYKGPAAVVAGAATKASVKLNVINNGTVATPKSPTKTRVELVARPDGAIDDSQDVVLATFDVPTPNLGAGKTKTQTLNFTYPANLPAGDYNLVAKVDTTGLLAETDENNNEAALAATTITVADPFVDLSGTVDGSKLPNDYVSGSGGKITLPLTVVNNGNVALAADAKITVTVVARPVGAVDDSQDVVVATFANQNVGKLAAGKNKKLNLNNITLPIGVADGDFVLVAKIDTTDVVDESDEDNNEAATDDGDPITVEQGTQDLAASIVNPTIPAAAIAGQATKIIVPVTITNNGNLPTNKALKIDVTISARPADAVDDSQDVVIGTFNDQTVSNLKPGSAKTLKLNVNLPANLAEGEYVLVAKIDTSNDLAETDEDNNEAVTGASVNVAEAFTDLSVLTATTNLGANAAGGSAGVANVVLKNLGNIDAKGKVDVKVFATLNGVIDGDAIEIGSAEGVSVSLKPNAAGGAIKVNLTLPDVIEATEFTLVAQVTPVEGITDNNDANDTATVANTVNVTLAPTFLEPLGDTITFTRTNLVGGPGPGGEAFTETGTWVDSRGNTGGYTYTTFTANIGPANNPVNKTGTILLVDNNIDDLVSVNIVCTFASAAARPQGIGGETIKFASAGTKDATVLVAHSPGAGTLNGVMDIL